MQSGSGVNDKSFKHFLYEQALLYKEILKINDEDLKRVKEAEELIKAHRDEVSKEVSKALLSNDRFREAITSIVPEEALPRYISMVIDLIFDFESSLKAILRSGATHLKLGTPLWIIMPSVGLILIEYQKRISQRDLFTSFNKMIWWVMATLANAYHESTIEGLSISKGVSKDLLKKLVKIELKKTLRT